jgi:hypothetical protein
MKRKKFKVQDEKQILIGMITSKEFLDRIVPIMDVKLLGSRMSQMIAFWCIDYYKNFEDAPGVHFEDIYRSKAKRDPNIDENLVSMMDEFLEALSREYERSKKFNVGYVFKKAQQHLMKNKMKRMISEVRGLISENQIEEAEQLVLEFNSLPSITDNTIKPFEDMEAFQRAFATQQEPLFKMPGALGELLNDDLRRGSFMAFMGREKIGKTFFLMEFGLKASMQRCSVAFFQAGDMSEMQQLRRIAIRMAGKSDREKFCGKQYLPILDCFWNQIDQCDLRYRECDFGIGIKDEEEFQDIFLQSFDDLQDRIQILEDDYIPCTKCHRRRPRNFRGSVWFKKVDLGDALGWREGWKESQRLYKKLKMRRFYLSTHANRTLTPQKMKQIIREWYIRDGFIPDVIITDYADILLPSGQDFRQGQNVLWQELRAMAQELDALVITATQADAQSYKSERLGLHNFTEDKRKYSHVTSIWGLNQLPWEKKAGIMRVNPLMMRDDDYMIDRQAKVIQSLKTGRPLIHSFF